MEYDLLLFSLYIVIYIYIYIYLFIFSIFNKKNMYLPANRVSTQTRPPHNTVLSRDNYQVGVTTEVVLTTTKLHRHQMEGK